MMINYHF